MRQNLYLPLSQRIKNARRLYLFSYDYPGSSGEQKGSWESSSLSTFGVVMSLKPDPTVHFLNRKHNVWPASDQNGR